MLKNMTREQKDSLDKHITGNWGEDSVRDDEHRGYVFIEEFEYLKLSILAKAYETKSQERLLIALDGAIQTIRNLVAELE